MCRAHPHCQTFPIRLFLIKTTETGCGKTTVVQLLGILLERHLHVINCHASTETSDLLGGLRPVRRREDIVQEMVSLVKELIESWPDQSQIDDLDIPSFLLHKTPTAKSYPTDAPSIIFSLTEKFVTINFRQPNAGISEAYTAPSELPPGSRSELKSSKKRRKLATGGHVCVREQVDVSTTASKVRELYQRYCSLFEWVDGPLVTR